MVIPTLCYLMVVNIILLFRECRINGNKIRYLFNLSAFSLVEHKTVLLSGVEVITAVV